MYFVEPFGQRGLFHLAYGTLARKQVDIQRQFFYEVVDITCLLASWQNLLEKIVPSDGRKEVATLRTTRNVAVVYSYCGLCRRGPCHTAGNRQSTCFIGDRITGNAATG